MMAGTAMVRAFQPNEPPPGSYYRPYAAGVGSYYGTYAGYRQLLRRLRQPQLRHRTANAVSALLRRRLGW
jgi:hypothetical protein